MRNKHVQSSLDGRIRIYRTDVVTVQRARRGYFMTTKAGDYASQPYNQMIERSLIHLHRLSRDSGELLSA